MAKKQPSDLDICRNALRAIIDSKESTPKDILAAVAQLRELSNVTVNGEPARLRTGTAKTKPLEKRLRIEG